LFQKKTKKRTIVPRLKTIKKAITPVSVAAGVRQSIIATIFSSMIMEMRRLTREKKRRKK
jgi:hypothetical protein